jgi:hypothetical protein
MRFPSTRRSRPRRRLAGRLSGGRRRQGGHGRGRAAARQTVRLVGDLQEIELLGTLPATTTLCLKVDFFLPLGCRLCAVSLWPSVIRGLH